MEKVGWLFSARHKRVCRWKRRRDEIVLQSDCVRNWKDRGKKRNEERIIEHIRGLFLFQI
ncbi:uncharacterized protein CELE_ZK822.9 [Caenorhabditis elegans]|uniref:Uncharacterized protein n=1 Tax=Caenorhabditis elegans TaxID=6239 RepID=I2HAB5_CAEEL|nr:Uncharacterized protein CELE_ZK822.9 [Caenorhabditis elegans]CCH63822.1 Uncharacterized protein CELE_ZK822.9 [Caenorhabditis elegans]|eukprot:NP_001255598.1 Uncharacterized protein CELE_ZK822.9 [Caenorhabditis elegans]